ncbi:hypothetical protein Pcinc_017016 [Petrolisthes cinctipes]|uniref:Uncharacterized protein n=1 Tax=Petrolisthes cinctipes TaxID=88211 RepID=A0AAE1FSI7_PETCI|nr:hypothetical protein Pcinc_017016 [Petrolisthes cinctipes]
MTSLDQEGFVLCTVRRIWKLLRPYLFIIKEHQLGIDPTDVEKGHSDVPQQNSSGIAPGTSGLRFAGGDVRNTTLSVADAGHGIRVGEASSPARAVGSGGAGGNLVILSWLESEEKGGARAGRIPSCFC